MERCHGKTGSGARCKRSAAEGSRYCGTHADQGGSGSPGGATGGTKTRGVSSLIQGVGGLVELAAAGVLIALAIALKRRFPLF